MSVVIILILIINNDNNNDKDNHNHNHNNYDDDGKQPSTVTSIINPQSWNHQSPTIIHHNHLKHQSSITGHQSLTIKNQNQLSTINHYIIISQESIDHQSTTNHKVQVHSWLHCIKQCFLALQLLHFFFSSKVTTNDGSWHNGKAFVWKRRKAQG